MGALLFESMGMQLQFNQGNPFSAQISVFVAHTQVLFAI